MKKPSIIIYIVIVIALLASVYGYSHTMHSGTISLHHHEDKKYHVLTVTMNNVSAPFFGTAFHLHYNPQQLAFDHYTLGNYFVANNPITLINDKKSTIVAGLSLKRGETIDENEGALLHIYFNKERNYKQNPTAYFSNTVFSTFTDKRKDIPVNFVPKAP